MQKWEYRTVTFYASSQGAAPQVVTIDDQQLTNGWFKWEEGDLPTWEEGNPTRAEYFNSLGEEGWELFFYGPSEAIFKRPKQTASDKPATDSPSPDDDSEEEDDNLLASDEPVTDSPSPWE